MITWYKLQNRERDFIILSLFIFLGYLVLIFNYPLFFADDFVIFGKIKENPDILFLTDPNSIFYLFFRPVSYLSFWIDFNFFNASAEIIKVVSILIFLFLFYSIWNIINTLAKLMNISTNRSLMFLFSILFAFHPDTQFSILWIANKTELLYLFFYSYAFLFFIKSIEKNKNIYLVLYLLFYFFSILSKQTGLHLPIFILLFMLFNNKTKYIKTTFNYHYYTILILSLLVLLLVLTVSYFYIPDTSNTLTNSWKKIFSIPGILFISFIPIFNQSVYNFFLLNKPFAIAILGIVLSIVFFFRKRIDFSKLIALIFIIIIISFPRISAPGGQRINTIYIYWAFIILSISFITVNEFKKYFLIIAAVILSLYIYKFIQYSDFILQNNKQLYSYDKLNNKFRDSRFATVAAISGYEGMFINYQYFYFKNGKFGQFYNNSFTSVFINKDLFDKDIYLYNKKIISVKLNNNLITVRSLEKLAYIEFNTTEIVKIKPLVIISSIPSPTGRGFSEITYELPKNLDLNNTKLIYFDGLEWKVLK